MPAGFAGKSSKSECAINLHVRFDLTESLVRCSVPSLRQQGHGNLGNRTAAAAARSAESRTKLSCATSHFYHLWLSNKLQLTTIIYSFTWVLPVLLRFSEKLHTQSLYTMTRAQQTVSILLLLSSVRCVVSSRVAWLFDAGEKPPSNLLVCSTALSRSIPRVHTSQRDHPNWNCSSGTHAVLANNLRYQLTPPVSFVLKSSFHFTVSLFSHAFSAVDSDTWFWLLTTCRTSTNCFRRKLSRQRSNCARRMSMLIKLFESVRMTTFV